MCGGDDTESRRYTVHRIGLKMYNSLRIFLFLNKKMPSYFKKLSSCSQRTLLFTITKRSHSCAQDTSHTSNTDVYISSQ